MRTESELAPRLSWGLDVPAVDVAAAQAAAEQLRQIAREAALAQALLADTVVDQWHGTAHDTYYQTRALAAGRADAATAHARTAATAIDHYADAVTPAMATMRRAAVDLEIALGYQATAADDTTLATATRAIETAHTAHTRAHHAYTQAVEDLRTRLRDIPHLPHQERTTAQHVRDAVGRFTTEGLVEPLTAMTMLGFGWVQDPAGWRAAWAGIPASLWDQATHPRRTAEELFAVPDFKNDQTGAAIGSLLSMAIVPAKLARAVASPDVQARFARNMADPTAPRPRVQTLDEMLDHVDLTTHEHHSLGHAIRRHVDVDDDYLHDRLDNGTLRDDATRDRIPPHASAWNDLDTANKAVTDVLRLHESDLRRLASGEITELPPIIENLPGPLGRVMSPRDGDHILAESGRVKVVVVRINGEVVIKSAYLEPP